MGAAAYNRGTVCIRRDADDHMPLANRRADAQAYKDEAARLREQVARLERDLARARRCIAELRRAKDARAQEARADRERSDLAISILCKRAFGDELKEVGRG